LSKRRIDLPSIFAPFAEPHRYKIAYGGRGGGRSWTIARLLLLRAATSPIRVLCAREYQSSIADSVHRLLSDQIALLNLDAAFEITNKEIRSKCGASFIFKGLRHNASEIKSTEGVDVCWVEEAHNVSAESWDFLIPTIRKPGSEIWVSFNPIDEDSETYQRFVVREQPDAVRIHGTVFDNPFAPQLLIDQANSDRTNDPDKFDWIWLGHPRRLTEASIFGDRVRITEFATPETVKRFYYGMDFGFSNDPSVVLRAYIAGDVLYIDHEASGVGIEITELPALIRHVPGADKWPIVADSSRPETISHLQREGINVKSSPKWAGSIEDGIAYIRGFREIVVHPRCRLLSTEAKWYSYKVDKSTGHVLPIVIDAHNHAWDALRYALAGEIKQGGGFFIGRA
jgi:phage terminase large subunit